jgi:hypothetical protein
MGLGLQAWPVAGGAPGAHGAAAARAPARNRVIAASDSIAWLGIVVVHHGDALRMAAPSLCRPAADPISRITCCSSTTSSSTITSCTIDRSAARWARWRTTRLARTCSRSWPASGSALDGLRTFFPLAVVCAALTAGFVFLIARRMALPLPFAICAPRLLLLPAQYFFGAFTHDAFLAQTVSTLFASRCGGRSSRGTINRRRIGVGVISISSRDVPVVADLARPPLLCSRWCDRAELTISGAARSSRS